MVWDAAGKAYLDMLAGTWCNILGHGHLRWVAAVRDQASQLTHVGAAFRTTRINEALLSLQEVLPPQLSRAVLLNTGSEAVELGLKIARAATGGGDVVVFERGYYGATVHALGLSEAGRAARYLPRLNGVHRLPAPTCRECPAGRSWPCQDFGCLDGLRALAGRGDHQIAAVLFEPVLAAGGMVVPPPGYGSYLRKFTTGCDALLISEEVTTGMGRTGLWFGFEHEGIVPDILILGKALGAGLPVSAVITTGEVETHCRNTLRHIQSHQNDPFSGRIAALVISILQEQHLIEKVAEGGTHLLGGLVQLQSKSSQIRDVRGRGLMVGVELEKGQNAEGAAIARRLLDAGVIVDYQPSTATIRLFPPYIISLSQIHVFLEKFAQALQN
jgi:4-aminobutyrate aminotransferase-like enzyme